MVFGNFKCAWLELGSLRYNSLTMRRLLVLLMLVLSCTACGPSRQPIPPGVIPEQKSVLTEDEQYGQQVLAGLTDHYQLDRDDSHVNRVRDIVDRLATAAHANKNPWNVYVFFDPKFKNAAATRGNYIFVWSGILDSIQNDEELAGILAHEIGHVLAGHTMANPQEEVTRMISGVLGSVTSSIISAAGSGYGILGDLSEVLVRTAIEAMLINPEQRAKELEADQVGFFLMADAGYDPKRCVEFWERVRTDPDFKGFPIQFLSTHPSSDDRLERLQGFLPEAEARYQQYLLRTTKPTTAAKSSPKKSANKDTKKETPKAKNRWVVNRRAIPVFSEANEHSPIVDDLVIDTELTVTEKQNEWLHIDTPLKGWVRRKDVAPYKR